MQGRVLISLLKNQFLGCAATNSVFYKFRTFIHYSMLLFHTYIVVNNFQTITEELVRKQESLNQSEELARMKEELNIELHRHENRMNKAR